MNSWCDRFSYRDELQCVLGGLRASFLCFNSKFVLIGSRLAGGLPPPISVGDATMSSLRAQGLPKEVAFGRCPLRDPASTGAGSLTQPA